MSSIGLSIDELVARTWSGAPGARYLARIDDLGLLAGEVLALVGPGAAPLRARLAAQTPRCGPVDGPAAARSGVLRIEAVRAAREGLDAVAVDDPFSAALDDSAADLALADLASIPALGLAAVVDLTDPTTAVLVADRVVVVDDGRPDRAYPVLAPRPRRIGEVAAVAERALTKLPPR